MTYATWNLAPPHFQCFNECIAQENYSAFHLLHLYVVRLCLQLPSVSVLCYHMLKRSHVAI